MAGHELRGRVLREDLVERRDPVVHRRVDEIGQGLRPTDVAGEEDVRVGDEREHVAAGVAWQREELHLALAEPEVHDARAEGERWVGELDRLHRVEAADLPLELCALVRLVRWRFAELFGRVVAPLLQLLGRGQEAAVLRRLPLHHVVVRHDGHAARGEDLIAAGVIEVVVRVDGELDRLRRQFGDLGDEHLRGRRSEKCIDHDHAAVADDEAGVARGDAAGPGHRGVDAVADLDDVEVGVLRERARGGEKKNG